MEIDKTSNLPCPCGKSSDGFSIQLNGWGHCFSSKCGPDNRNFPPDTFELPEGITHADLEEAAPRDAVPVSAAETYRAFPERGFSRETILRYKVDVGGPNAKYLAKYPLYTPTGEHVANKVRYPNKGFSFEGDVKGVGLFGRHAFPPGSAKAITVTEGQDDALAVHQLTGNKFPAVSVHSASSAERDCRKDFEYLNSFEKVVFCFDSDEAGMEAARRCANLPFPLGKVRVLTLREYKDANDYVINKKRDVFNKEWWDAPEHRPDGLKLGSEMWEEIITRNESFTTLYPWERLNEKTYGIRLSELVVVTADTGVGKTSFLKHIEHRLLTDPEIIEEGYGVGFLHLEEPNGDTALGLLSVHNGVPYHLPDSERPEEDIRKAYDEVLNNSRVVIWDHFGSNSVDAVLDKIRHMYAMGCRYIVLDHLSIVVSDQSGDERKQLDEIATKLKTLTMELDLAVIAVIHTNRQGQIRGTAGVEQLANMVIHLHRNVLEKDEWRRNVTELFIEKNRFCGFTGPAGHLFYNRDTGLLNELDYEEAAVFDSGGTLGEDYF